MGLLESDVRHRRRDRPPRLSTPGAAPPAFVVHGFDHAAAALAAAAEANRPIRLVSAPAAAGAAGAGWFRALLDLAARAYPGVAFEGVLDCYDAPGLALGALQIGIHAVCYDGPAAQRIADIARQSGGVVYPERPLGLDLQAVEERRENLIAACRNWIAAAPLQSAPPSGIPSGRMRG
ncbi:MAG: hypothetical protein AB7G39_16895 [Alphaproteobacteria bacterium]